MRIPDYDEAFLPNFRLGDVVVLYERNCPKDNVTNKNIFGAPDLVMEVLSKSTRKKDMGIKK